jgi:hypothetical protein
LSLGHDRSDGVADAHALVADEDEAPVTGKVAVPTDV